MYDPLVVDVFTANYKRIMPVEEAAAHPAAKAVGGAREAAPPPQESPEAEAGADTATFNEVLTISSLARAVSGNASLSDVGALAWMTLRNVIPANAMALFVEDQQQDLMTVSYAVGAHAALLRQLKKGRGGGIAGWVAVNRRGVLNADAALDLGVSAASLEPPLRSSLTVPLAHEGRVVGVLSCYSQTASGFTEDHLRLLELAAASLASALVSVAPAESAGARPAAVNAGRRGTGSTVLSIVR
jgi:putative methionine-R-sulfoxide reductase with GAF domain